MPSPHAIADNDRMNLPRNPFPGSQWTLSLPVFSLLLALLGGLGAVAVVLVQYAAHPWALPLLLLLVFALLGLAGWTLHALRSHINQRMQAEQERDQFFKLSLDMLGVVGFDGTIHQMSPAIERILGFRSEDVIGTHFFDYGYPLFAAITLLAFAFHSFSLWLESIRATTSASLVKS